MLAPAASAGEAVGSAAVDAPEIESLSVEEVSLGGGDEVVVTGRNFAPECVVTYGDAKVREVAVVSEREIRILVPAVPMPGNWTLTVATRGGSAQHTLLARAKRLAELAAREITTVAGGAPNIGDGGLATAAWLSDFPGSVTVDVAGNLFIADPGHHRVRRVDISTGLITTVAGTGAFGYNGDDKPATAARLNSPSSVALDAAGNLFIADTYNNRIRRVEARTGRITTVAGTGEVINDPYGDDLGNYNGDHQPATTARLAYPNGVALDAAGNLFIADSRNHRVRRVSANTGQITTVAGTGIAGYGGDDKPATAAQLYYPRCAALDAAGNLFIADSANRRIRRVDAATGRITTVAGTGEYGYDGDDKPATAAQLASPFGVTLDAAGDLFIADSGNNRIRRVTASTGQITTVAGTGVRGYDGDEKLATAAQLASPIGVALDAAGDLFIADSANRRIRRADAATARITTVAGTDGYGYDGDDKPATAAQLFDPGSVAFDAAGDLFIADSGNNRIRQVEASTGQITTVAGTGVRGYDGDDQPATTAQLSYPRSVALDAAGNLFIADSGNNRVRRVDAATGRITTVAGTGIAGYDGDDKPAATAQLANPSGVALDAAGDLFIADTSNNRVRRVDAATGQITTVAGTGVYGYDGDAELATNASLANPLGVAIDVAGNLFIADTRNQRVRRVDADTGRIATVAGVGFSGSEGDDQLATTARLYDPSSVALDAAGNLFIADSGNNGIRRVRATTGLIATVAGTGKTGYRGDEKRAKDARLNSPASVALDAAGNLFIADKGNHAIRAVKSR